MKRSITLLLLACTLTAGAFAQKSDNQPKDRTAMITRNAERIANSLKLDDKTQTWFVGLYTEYQTKMGEINKIGRPADAKDGKPEKQVKKKELTDEQAMEMIENTFKKEEQKVALQRAYLPKFQEKLTPQQLVTVFCTANRPMMNPRNGMGNRQGGQPNVQRGGFGGFGGDPGFNQW